MRRLCLIALVLVAGCGGSETAAERAVDDVRDGDAVLVDVRSDREFAAGRAEDVRHLDHADVLKGARPQLAKDETIYVYCRSGRRAAEVERILERDGWTDVTSIGGLRDWQAAGGAVTS